MPWDVFSTTVPRRSRGLSGGARTASTSDRWCAILRSRIEVQQQELLPLVLGWLVAVLDRPLVLVRKQGFALVGVGGELDGHAQRHARAERVDLFRAHRLQFVGFGDRLIL